MFNTHQRLRGSRAFFGFPAIVVVTGFLSAHTPLRAQTSPQVTEPNPLRISDAIPPLPVDRLLSGPKVPAFDAGRVTVVVCVSSWSTRSMQRLPMVTELAAKLEEKNVTFVVAFVLEGSHAMDVIQPLVAATAFHPQCSVVFAGVRSVMDQTWLAAAEIETVPVAFVVDGEGRLGAIHSLIASKSGTELESSIARVRLNGAEPTLEVQDAVAFEPLRQAWNTSKATGDFAAMQAAAEQLLIHTGLEAQSTVLEVMRVGLTQSETSGPCAKWVKRVVESHSWNQPAFLNSVAWFMVDDPSVVLDDFEIATQIAQRAVDLSQSKDGAILDTLATALFRKGDRKQAVEIQRQAVRLAPAYLFDELDNRRKTFEAALEEANEGSNQPSSEPAKEDSRPIK